jgi:hypothetical protein
MALGDSESVKCGNRAGVGCADLYGWVLLVKSRANEVIKVNKLWSSCEGRQITKDEKDIHI